MSTPLNCLLEGLHYPECPRWRDGKLWFSDIPAKQVRSLGLQGNDEVVATLDDEPAGLGWDSNGNLLIVSTEKNKLLRLVDGSLEVAADLGELSDGVCNDMVVDTQGRAFIGHFNGKFKPDEFAPSGLLVVDADGNASVATGGVKFPNGAVITPDGKNLIIAESFGRCLTEFTINDDGTLSNGQLWADLGKAVPDGICLDAEGAVWVTDPMSGTVQRVSKGGKVEQTITMEGRKAFACVLGGENGKTLYICAADGFGKFALNGTDTGAIFSIEVDVPAADNQ